MKLESKLPYLGITIFCLGGSWGTEQPGHWVDKVLRREWNSLYLRFTSNLPIVSLPVIKYWMCLENNDDWILGSDTEID